MTKLTHSPFFKVSCGCIGLQLDEHNWIVIKRCDRDYSDNPIQFWISREYVDDKTYTPLDAAQTKALVEDIGMLLAQGFYMLELCRNIKFCQDVKLQFPPAGE